jgi:hypothetical protein
MLHLAPDPEQTKALVASGVTAIAYETVTDRNGGLPLLAPMSEVAGRMSIQAGAHALEKAQGGSGVLLGGVPGVKPAEVLVIGGGVVGINAARMAMGMNADVTILDRSLTRLKELDELYGDRLTTIYSSHDAIEERLATADRQDPREDERSSRLRNDLRDALHLLDLPPKWEEWEGDEEERPAYARAVAGPAVFVEGHAVRGADGVPGSRAKIIVAVQEFLARR